MRFLVCALLLAATTSSAPRVINHPPIPLKADASAFAPSRTGCKGDSGLCEKGPLAGLCDRITIDDDLGGLALPTAHCWKYHTGPMLLASEYIRGPRGMMQVYERLVVLDHGQYRVLKNKSDFYTAANPVMTEAQFGCGQHSTYLVTERVSRVGGVSEISSIKAFEDPKQDGLCVD